MQEIEDEKKIEGEKRWKVRSWEGEKVGSNGMRNWECGMRNEKE